MAVLGTNNTSLFILISVLLGVRPALFAQRLPTPDALTVDDGLCFRDVNSIAQDKNGLMWFGTAKGLSRYDGYRFVNFGNEAGSDIYFPASKFERDGALFRNDSILWVIADFKLIAMNIFNFETEPIRDIEGRVLHLMHGTKNDIWLISDNDQEQFLWHFTEENGFEKMSAVPHFRMDLSDFNLDTKGRLWWSSTTQGLQEYSPAGKLLRRVTNLENLFFHDEKMDYTDFFIDSQNRFFVYSMKKQAAYELWQYSFESNRKDVLMTGFQNYFLVAKEDSQGDLWFGMDEHLLKLQPNGRLIDFTRAANQKLDFSVINAIFEDRTNMLWVGTNGGLLKMPIGKQLFENILAKKGVGWGNSIRGIGEDRDGNLFFFCNAGDRGFYQMNRKNKKPVKINFGMDDESLLQLLGLCTYFIYDPERNCIWTIFKTLIKIDLNTKKVEAQPLVNMGLFYGDFNAITLLPDGQILAGNILENLTLFNPETGVVKKLWKGKTNEKEPILIKTFFAQGNDSLWVGTDRKGLYLFNQNGDLLQHYYSGSQPGLNNDHVLCIQLDEYRDWLWVGTFGGGMNGINLQTGEVRVFNHQNGLPDNNVVSILDDGDNLWIGTYNGLSCFNKAEADFQNYYEADGLTHNEFNFSSAFKSSDGQMYFGGMNGINSFYPKNLLRKELNPPLKLVRFTKYDQRRDSLFDYQQNDDFQGPIVISPDISYFQFDWTLPDYFNPGKNQYSTWMEGLEKDWQPFSNTHNIRFNKLPPGTYTLHIKGKDSRGFWSEKPLVLEIKVLSPWWKRWWAYGLFSCIALGGIAFLWRYQLGRIQLQNQLEKKQVEAAQLRKLDHAKTQFFSNISHEFRTPLTVILGMSEEIKEPKTAKQLIRRSGQNLLRLVNQMLDFSKLEAGKLTLQVQSGELVTYLHYLVESFQSLAAYKNVQLIYEPALDLLEMDFDEGKIQHIVSNLLSNAIKFTPRDGRVTLSLSRSEQAICIQVADTGIGIPAALLPRVFERYFQVADPMSKGEPGSGIGLAFTKELVELMDGQIEVESEEGMGTVVRVLLPLAKTADPGVSGAAPKELENVPLPDADHVEMPGLPGQAQNSLLIIEDNPEVVSYIRTLLEKDYKITVAENGETGIAKAIEQIPDIIISDVMMPVKDGFAVTQFLKNDERTSHIPIVLLTAKADAESRLIGLERGADAYLAKPFEKKELLVRLEQLIALRKKLQARYAQFAPPQPTEDVGLRIEDAFLQKINDAIEAHLDDAGFNVNELCQSVGLSRPQLFRKVKALTDKSIVAYLRSARLHKALELLRTGEHNISEVAFDVGFNDPLYFSRAFSREFGFPPTALIK